MAWRTTEEADEDIADIEIYGTLNFGRRRAEEYVDGLFAVFRLIVTMPRMAAEHPGLPGAPRVYVFRSHNIFYTLDGADILIVRVLHGAQDAEQYL